MKTQHTPTPWAVEGDDSEGGIPFIQIIRDVPTGADFKPIAKVDCSYDEKKDHWFLADEDHANAAFIVTACNTHDELVDMLQSIHDHGYAMQDHAKVQNLLAKAKGE